MKKNVINLLILTISLVGFSCAHHERGGDEAKKEWPFYQGDILHKGYVETDIAPDMAQKWAKEIKEGSSHYAPQEYSSPAAGNDLVYFGSLRGSGVTAMNYQNGETVWHFEVKKGVEGSPALYEGGLYFGGNDGYLYAVDAQNGSLLWKFEADAELLSSPVAAGGMLYFASASDILYAIDSKTSEVIWRYKKGGGGLYSIRGASSPAYSDGVVYIGFTDGTIAALNAFDGSLMWEKRLKGRSRGMRFNDVDSSPVLDGDVIYAASYGGGLYALNRKDGKVIWRYDGGGLSTPAFDENRVYFSEGDGRLIALAKEDGNLIWKFEEDSGLTISPIVVGAYIVAGSTDKTLYLFDKKKGEIVDRFKASSGFSASPIYYRGSIYAISNRGYAYALGR